MNRKLHIFPVENGYLKVKTKTQSAVIEPRIIKSHNSFSCRLVIYTSNMMDIIPLETSCGYDRPEKTVTYDLQDLKIIKAVSFTFYGDHYAVLLGETGQLWLALPSKFPRGSLEILEGFNEISDIDGSFDYEVIIFDRERKISFLNPVQEYHNPFSKNN